ncbi:MAG: hypothetical protein PHE25_04025 [Candidatus Gracilibacteria bacterium]|nr:hypothetical protein [Candidatus Gracilibacteria bacterium]
MNTKLINTEIDAKQTSIKKLTFIIKFKFFLIFFFSSLILNIILFLLFGFLFSFEEGTIVFLFSIPFAFIFLSIIIEKRVLGIKDFNFLKLFKLLLIFFLALFLGIAIILFLIFIGGYILEGELIVSLFTIPGIFLGNTISFLSETKILTGERNITYYIYGLLFWLFLLLELFYYLLYIFFLSKFLQNKQDNAN